MKCIQFSILLLLGDGLVFPAKNSHYGVIAEEEEILDADITATSLNVSFTVLPFTSLGECYGGNSTGLGDTSLRLQFRSNATSFQWVEVARDIPINVGAYSTMANVSTGSGCVEFRLLQQEHGGGHCNCWTVELSNDTMQMELEEEE